jgi:hypothetical protein
MLACTLAYSLWLSLFPLVLHHLSLCCLLYYIILPTCASSPFALTVALYLFGLYQCFGLIGSRESVAAS